MRYIYYDAVGLDGLLVSRIPAYIFDGGMLEDKAELQSDVEALGEDWKAIQPQIMSAGCFSNTSASRDDKYGDPDAVEQWEVSGK